jgi:hypothetical protein
LGHQRDSLNISTDPAVLQAFSKTINDVDGDGGGGGITFYNRRLEKGRANYDTSHRFVSVFIAELPFGKNRKFVQSGLLSKIVGGWEFMYSHTLQTGVPVSIGFAGSPFNYLPGTRRANQILPNDQAKFDGWDIGANRFPHAAQNPLLNIDAFAYPAAFTARNRWPKHYHGHLDQLGPDVLLEAVPDRRKVQVHSSPGYEQSVQDPGVRRSRFHLQHAGSRGLEDVLDATTIHVAASATSAGG